jgi:hypothetical protein
MDYSLSLLGKVSPTFKLLGQLLYNSIKFNEKKKKLNITPSLSTFPIFDCSYE